MKNIGNIIRKLYQFSGGWIGARYIYKELLLPFFFSISVVTFVLLLNFILKAIDKLLGKNLPLLVILEWIYLNMAWIIAMSVPMAVLVASIMAYGRMAEDNEIIAMRSSGISFLSTLAPAIIFGIVVCISMIYFQNKILPEYNHKARLLTGDIYHKRPGLNIEPGYFIDDIPGYSIYVKNKKDGCLFDLIIYKKDSPETRTTIYADSGRINIKGNKVLFTLYEGEIHELDVKDFKDYRRISFNRHIIGIPVDNLMLERRDKSRRGDREMTIKMMQIEVDKYLAKRNEINDKIEKMVKDKLNIVEYKNFATLNKYIKSKIDSNLVLLSENEAKLKNRELKGLITRIKGEQNYVFSLQKQINKYQVEIHKKISMPVACIVFILIGVPLGIMTQQGGIALAAVASLFFFIIYYIFLTGGETLADMVIIPPYVGMWTPNVLLTIVGIYLIYSTSREQKTIDLSIFPKLINSLVKKILFK